jgi:hypothetical protein
MEEELFLEGRCFGWEFRHCRGPVMAVVGEEGKTAEIPVYSLCASKGLEQGNSDDKQPSSAPARRRPRPSLFPATREDKRRIGTMVNVVLCVLVGG